ncbi:MAG: hypothetical protein ACI9MC_000980 [Kiritimatiellia bacterium]
MKLAYPLLLLALTLPIVQTARASEPDVMRRTTQILTRAIAYDRKLRARSGEDISIAILYDPHHLDDARASIATLQELAGTHIRGLPVRAIALPWTNIEDLEHRMLDNDVDILWLCGDDLLPHIEGITQSTRKHNILTMAPNAKMVRAGASLGAQSDGAHIQLYINLPASRAEGVAFGTELLQLAQVYQ